MCSWTYGLDLLLGQCLIFKIWDSFLWEAKEADKKYKILKKVRADFEQEGPTGVRRQKIILD